MGIEKIKKKIMRDAEKEVKRVTDATKVETDRIKKENKKRRDEYKVRFDEHTAALVQLYKQKTLAQARLEAKNSLLQEREAAIETMLAKVVDAVDTRTYNAFLERTLKKSSQTLGKKLSIRCAQQDVATVKRLAKKLKLQVKVAAAEITGGMLVEDPKGKHLDESLAAVIERKRQALRQAVAKEVAI